MSLTRDEITDLLVAASTLDDGSEQHALLRDVNGVTLAIYEDSVIHDELRRGTDWWMGPIVLLAVLLMIVGAATIARGFVNLLF